MLRTLRLATAAAAVLLLSACGGGTTVTRLSSTPDGDLSSTAIASGNPGDSDASVSASPSPSAKDAQFGETNHVEDDEGNVYDITVGLPAETTPDSGLSDVKGTLYATTVTVTVTAGSAEVNPYNFTAKAADGTTFDATIAEVDDELPAETTPAGQSAKGRVTYDVPAGMTIALINYISGLGNPITWRVAS